MDDQKWQNDAATIKDRYQYAYDRTGSRMFRDNLTATLKDHYFFRNGLDQVSTAKQGDLNAGRTDITGTPALQEAWTLESHGNWRALVQTTSGTTTLNQTRTHTKANEVTTIAATVGTNWGDGVLDRNGFMTRVPKPGNEGQRWRLESDAWFRLVRVRDDGSGSIVAEYKYDGMHRRTVKLKPNGANWDRRDYYYSCEWQVVEERELLNTASKTTVATVPKFQWVWGVTYIDEIIVRDENKDGDGDCVDGTDQRLYPTQDGNYNVTSLIDTAGTVVERVLYDAYGKHTLWNAAWSATQSSTLYNNEVLYAGYRLDPESGLYQVRHRHYHPTLGRWVQRDPIGYHDGMSLYEYAWSRPTTVVDPLGLQQTGPQDRRKQGRRECCGESSVWCDLTHIFQSIQTHRQKHGYNPIGGNYPGDPPRAGDVANPDKEKEVPIPETVPMTDTVQKTHKDAMHLQWMKDQVPVTGNLPPRPAQGSASGSGGTMGGRNQPWVKLPPLTPIDKSFVGPQGPPDLGDPLKRCCCINSWKAGDYPPGHPSAGQTAARPPIWGAHTGISNNPLSRPWQDYFNNINADVESKWAYPDDECKAFCKRRGSRLGYDGECTRKGNSEAIQKHEWGP